MGFNLCVAKIVSGGQTGVDRGALEAAVKAQFPYGGMIPRGRLAEDGIVPEKFMNMVESESEDYRFRTRWNVESADATLILSFVEEFEGGTQRTRQYCMNACKPFFIDDPSNPKMDGNRIAVFKWLEDVGHKNGDNPLALNVAGPRESKSPGIAEASERYVSRIISAQAGSGGTEKVEPARNVCEVLGAVCSSDGRKRGGCAWARACMVAENQWHDGRATDFM